MQNMVQRFTCKTKGSYKGGCEIWTHEEWYRYGSKKGKNLHQQNTKTTFQLHLYFR